MTLRDKRLADTTFETCHPELHHYTTWPGLKGIVEQNCLWATHCLYLNDSSETKILANHLPDFISHVVKQVLSEIPSKRSELDKLIQQHGIIDVLVGKEAVNFTNIFYKVTFEQNSLGANCNPFIASFCSHFSDTEYERTNGLLSQWRGYGGDGGFALVFNTNKLIEMLQLELGQHLWTHLNINEVKYSAEDWKTSSEFLDLIDALAVFYKYVLNQRRPDPNTAHGPFVASATLLKHEAFKEEREVRIAASPTTELMLESHRRAEPQRHSLPPAKPILTRERSGQQIRYISLFNDLSNRLPVEKVIVGPSSRQDTNYAKAVALSGGRFEVTRSATPLVQFW